MIVKRRVQHITSRFGKRKGFVRLHKGVDLRSWNDNFNRKLNVALPEDALFLRVVWQDKWGYTYVFKGLESNYVLKFTHMGKSSTDFREGQDYKKGTIISKTVVTEYMKKKGYSDHLHFETWKYKVPRNPEKYMTEMGIEYA
jgi:murein DD-endopeptidase MepM/ murein hydrolase activator NlpD